MTSGVIMMYAQGIDVFGVCRYGQRKMLRLRQRAKCEFGLFDLVVGRNPRAETKSKWGYDTAEGSLKGA